MTAWLLVVALSAAPPKLAVLQVAHGEGVPHGRTGPCAGTLLGTSCDARF